jgi:hypothetical protein
MRAGERILGKDPFSLVARPPFYRQFVGSDTEQRRSSGTSTVGYMLHTQQCGGVEVPGKGLFSQVARPTFYRQFVGGDMEQEFSSVTSQV